MTDIPPLSFTRSLLQLAADLRQIQSVRGPTAELLAAAPLLSEWELSTAPMPLLIGYVTGHPELHDCMSRTSTIVAMDESRMWARTFSRFYRLGTPRQG